jgi:hypothetical protein
MSFPDNTKINNKALSEQDISPKSDNTQINNKALLEQHTSPKSDNTKSRNASLLDQDTSFESYSTEASENNNSFSQIEVNFDDSIDNSRHSKFSSVTGVKLGLSKDERSLEIQNIAYHRGLRLRALLELGKLSVDGLIQLLPFSLTKSFKHLHNGLELVLNKFDEYDLKGKYTKHNGSTISNIGRIVRGTGCLTLKLAEAISRCFSKLRILVTNKWILTGHGDGPKLIKFDIVDIKKMLLSRLSTDAIDEEFSFLFTLMIKELFISSYNGAMTLTISEKVYDYEEGDLVCGVHVQPQNIQLLHGKICIIDNMCIRKVYITNNQYNKKILVLCNNNMEYEVLEQYPKLIAPVSFHYSPIPISKSAV